MKKILALLVVILTLNACVSVRPIRHYRFENHILYPGLYPNYYRPGYPVYGYQHHYNPIIIKRTNPRRRK